MNSAFGESVPGLAEREVRPVGARELVLVLLVLLLGLVFRSLNLNDAWSGRPNDFHSAFGGGSTGGPARNFYSHGFTETRGVPFEWRVELEDGSRVYSYYPHHPTTCISITALSMMLFGPSEWAARLPWILSSMLALIGVWRLARLIWNPRLALVAMLFTSVIPFASHFASMLWIDGFVVFTYTLVLYRYVLWMRSGAGRDLLFAAFYAFLGGLSEWTAIFILPGLGLHALFVFGKQRQWKALGSTLILPLAVLLGFAAHAFHLHLVLSREELSRDTSSTLEWVMSLPVPLPEFLDLQWHYLHRYLTPPVTTLVVLGTLWALMRYWRSNRTASPSREEGVLWPLALSGILYIVVFPGRSTNHNFFAELSVPFFGIIAALYSCACYRSIRRANSIRATIWPTLVLLAIGAYSAVLARERGANPEISFLDPATWLFLPLLIARSVPLVALLGCLFALARDARRAQAKLALACALSGAMAFAAWDDVRFWSTQRSDRIGALVREPFMDELLHDGQAVIVTTGNYSMPLQFYSAAPVFISVYSVERLTNLKRRIFSKLGSGRRVVFLFEKDELQRQATAGRLKPEVLAELSELRLLLGSISAPQLLSGLEVFDLAQWSQEPREASVDD